MFNRISRFSSMLATFTLLIALTLVVSFVATPVQAGGGGCSGTYMTQTTCRNSCAQMDCYPGFYKCYYRTYNVLINPAQYQQVSAVWGPPPGQCYLGTGSCPSFCN